MTNTYVSCCVAVQNIERNLFLLPRSRRVDKQGNVKEEVDISSVYTEFDAICGVYKIPKFLSKPVERKYAFDLPGIPGTGEYLKVIYPYSCKYGIGEFALELLYSATLFSLTNPFNATLASPKSAHGS